MAVSKEEIADAMFEMVKEYHGKKNLKALDLIKAMRKKYGEDEADKKLCKSAIKILMDNGRCVYNYVGGSYIAMPPDQV
jgi:hypothetical protein